MEQMSPWIENHNGQKIEMSSRIRLARNVKDIVYPHMLENDMELKEMSQKISSSFPNFNAVHMKDKNILEKQLMVEKFLISPLFVKRGYSVIVSPDESTSIMVGEEDHIRIQVMNIGQTLMQLYQSANTIDETLEKEFIYQFDSDYGYKTACPTNVGTGLRASVMLHLPALTENRRIKRLRDVLTRMGYTLRGIYGEGTEPIGDVYQLSNQVTLGLNETEIIRNLDDIKEQIILEEQQLREWFYHNRALTVRDIVFRSYGLLCYAEQMSLEEAAKHLSHIKFGIDMDMIELEAFEFQKILKQIQHAFIRQMIESSDADSHSLEAAENKERARLLKDTIGGE